MKTFFTFLFFAKKTVSFLSIIFCLVLISLRSLAQTTATEDFENETVGATTFSEGTPTANFNHTFNLVNVPGYGYGGSSKYLELFMSGSTVTKSATISINSTLNPNLSYKINSFAAYVSAGGSGATPYNGEVTVSGTPVGSSTPVSAVIGIGSSSGGLPAGQTRDGNGTVSGITFTGTALAGLYFTSLTFTINDNNLANGNIGTRYLELDHIDFTTALPVTNQFSISDASILEGSSGTKSMAFTVSCSSTTTASSVQVQSSNGSATAGSDYVAYPITTVSFAAGSATSQTVSVAINGDLTVENDETFNMTLLNPSGGTISKAVGIGTILDDDNITETFEDETVSISNNSTVNSFSERGFSFRSNGELYVSRGNDIGSGNCSCTTTGLDTRANGVGTTGNVGSFYLNSTGTSFNLNSLEVFTSSDDGNTGNSGSVNVTFIGTKADGTGTVSYTATVGPFSQDIFQTVSFAGTPLANVQLQSVSITLGSGINYISLDNIKFGTVTFNPGTLLSINDVSVLEGTGGGTSTATFSVTRSNNNSAFSVNVAASDLSATAGTDYTAFSTTLNFASGGALTQTVNVNILHDATIETNETFNMTLSGATNGVLYQKQVGLGTILDDDKVTETFEDETTNATTFSENTVAFASSGRLKVLNSTRNGSNSSDFYLSSFSNSSGGSVGKISITSANKAFKLLQLDMLTSSGNPTINNVVTGPVTFTGTLLNGSTVSTTKTISPTALSGLGFQKGITFTGTPLDNVLLTALEFSAGGSITTIDIDNFTYAAFITAPYLEITDASNNTITNNNTAATTNSTDFGTVCTANTVTKTYTIKNTGAVNLTFSGSPVAALGGTNANQFSITQPTSSTVAAGATITFSVTYSPTVAGAHNATITLTSNDALNTPFVINVKGIANLALSLTTPASITSGACTGNPVSFTTSGSGSGTLSYQWYLGNTALSDATQAGNSIISGSSSAKLTINNPSTADNATNYNVRVSSTTGCSVATSNNISLTITAPATATTTASNSKVITTTNTVITDGSCNLIATIVPSGAAPISASNGNVTATVTVASSVGNYNSKAYLQRHYDIVPASGASTATATITLYFTQTEFTNFNTYTGRNSLPTGPTDPNGGKANIRITQYHGTGTAPGNYTGTGVDINPVDANITWNATYSRWEVKFDVVGFSGFYLSDATTILPLTLLNFAATAQNGTALLQWATTNEVNTSNFEVFRSTNGVDFIKIGQLPTTGNGNSGTNNYQYKDGLGISGVYYYQLKMIDIDGRFTTSNIVAVNNGLISNTVLIKATPNPFQSKILLNVDAANEAQLNIELVDMNGKKLFAQSKVVTKGSNTISLNGLDNLAHGTYIVHIFNNNINKIIKMIKN